MPNIQSDPADWINLYGKVALTGESLVTERYADVRKKWYHISAYSPQKNYFVSIFEDISERKIAEQQAKRQNLIQQGANTILEAALKGTEEALGEVCLLVAEQVTQSKFGFIGEINPKGLEDIAISNPGWEACKIIASNGHRRPPGNFKIHGLYGKVLSDGKSFYTNDPAHHPDSIGLPAGHPPLASFLGVPLKSDGKTIGMIAVGNREGGFTDTELAALESLAPVIVGAFQRKKAEEATRQSEERFSKVFSQSPVAVIITRLSDGRYVDVNDAFQQIFEYSRSEVIGRTSPEINVFTAPEGRAAFLSLLNKEGRIRNQEMAFKTKSGRIIQTLLSVEKLTINGEDHLLTTLIDITERKKAEEALKQSEEKYRSLFANMIDGFAHCQMLYDNEGNPIDFVYLDVNDAFERLTRLKRETVVGKKVSEAIPGTIEANPELIETYGRVASTGKKERFEIYFKPLATWFSVSVYSERKGYFIAVFEDITERKQVEDALKKLNDTLEQRVHERTKAADNERQRLYQVLETLPSYVILLDKNYKTLFANKVFRESFGESKGRPCYGFLFNRDSACENCETYKVLKTNKPHRWQWTGPNERDYDIYDFPFVNQDGSTAVLEMGLDITDRKHAEKDLQKYREHLEQMVAERTEALHESEQRWSTTLTSIGDAVIATDTEGKITFMNPVAEELTGWTLNEAKQIPIKQVFNIINEHTRKEVESPVTKVLREGLIVGLANHTLLIRKDGTEVPIDDSGAPIVTEDGGAIRGVVLVFRDITERKKNEDAIQRQAALIDLSPDAIIVRALDGTINFWSKGAEKLYGWTKKEAIGKSTHALFETKFPEPLDSIMDKLNVNKKWSGELVHRTKSGKEVTVQSWWQAEETTQGKIKSILESNVDLTERKKSEVEIAQAKQRLDAHMDNSPEAVIEFDPEFRVIRWSEQATRVFGWTKEEILGKSIAEMPWVYADDIGIVQQISTDLLNGKRPRIVSSNRNLRKDGSIVDCEWYNSAIYDANGKLVSILAQVLDVTERKRAEKEIARLASFPTLNPNPVIEVTVEGKITYINPATKRLFHTLEVEGLKHIFFYDWEHVQSAFEDKSTNTFGREVKINGHWYHQQLYLVPQTKQIRIYAIDIDELKQTEQARARAQEKLEENAVMLEEYASQMEELAEQRAQQLQNAERLAAIGQTAGMVGHDIRNPLQAITSDMYIISEEAKDMEDGENKEAIMESIDSVNQNLGYINKIVSDLQDYTRPLKPNLQDANLSELIEGTLLTINVPKGIEVSTNVANNAKPIKADIAYMRRILTNLMTNAVQAMQEEGKLTIQATKTKDVTVITVQDTGVGIPDEVKAKMFTPLFTTKSKGQGLGLAVVKRLVEALQGNIVFESVAGKGTKFTVELPQTR